MGVHVRHARRVFRQVRVLVMLIVHMVAVQAVTGRVCAKTMEKAEDRVRLDYLVAGGFGVGDDARQPLLQDATPKLSMGGFRSVELLVPDTSIARTTGTNLAERDARGIGIVHTHASGSLGGATDLAQHVR
jgi:hypothetical protein